jgi:hypothetical protein
VIVRLTLQKKDGAKPERMAVGQSTELELDPFRPVIIGRSPSVDLHVDAPSVGHKAVGLTLESDGVWIRDLGSGGGSALEWNGAVIHRPQCLLKGEAILAIGAVTFHIAVVSQAR